jgi:hypothetical protein
MPTSSDAEREQELDELEADFESSDDEAGKAFKIRDALPSPVTKNVTTGSLHCQCRLLLRGKMAGL